MGIFNRRSFRVDILTAFGTLLLITFLAVIVYNYRSTSRIVLMLCDDLMKQTTQTVIGQTVSFLNPPAKLTELSARLAASGILPFGDLAKLERFAIEGLSSQSQIAMFLIGDRAGNFLLAKPEVDGSIATKFINRKVKPPLTTWKYWDKGLQVIRIETLNTTDTYDPRSRPWYQGAEEKKGLHWTDLYIFYTGKKPGDYRFLSGHWTPRDQVAGVIGCDIELVQLSDFLQSLKIGKHGLAFIINEKQELVAYPDLAQVMVDPGETGSYARFGSIPWITAALWRHTGNIPRRARRNLLWRRRGERYRASFTDFPPSFGKPWKVGMVIPENDFIGEVKELTRRVLVICSFFYHYQF